MNEPILDYNYFSYRVYLVDPLKKVKSSEAKPSKSVEETTPNNVNYEILDISRNGTYGNKNQYGVPNHMQAMTVALNYIGADYAKK